MAKWETRFYKENTAKTALLNSGSQCSVPPQMWEDPATWLLIPVREMSSGDEEAGLTDVRQRDSSNFGTNKQQGGKGTAELSQHWQRGRSLLAVTVSAAQQSNIVRWKFDSNLRHPALLWVPIGATQTSKCIAWLLFRHSSSRWVMRKQGWSSLWVKWRWSWAKQTGSDLQHLQQQGLESLAALKHQVNSFLLSL